MKNLGGRLLTTSWLFAFATVGMAACSVYDSKMLDDGNKMPPDGKDAGADGAMPMVSDAGGMDASGDAMMSCEVRKEICNGMDDDCDDFIDEVKATKVDCEKKRPNTIGAGCTNGACFFDSCKSGFDDVDGTPQNGCERCPNGVCDDAGVDDGGAP